jgi:hypothetical protein
MSGQHTPGPWFFREDIPAIGVEGDGCFEILDHENPSAANVLCTRQPWLEKRDEMVANARLMSAAPELLEALKGYMEAVNTMNAAMKDGLNVHGAISGLIGAEDNAKAAIAKASLTTTDAGVAG